MIVTNVQVYDTKKCSFHHGEIHTRGSCFVGESDALQQANHNHVMENPDKEPVIDGKGCYAIPGLIDIHLHGGDGADFCDGTLEAIERIARYELRCGVTAFAAATMTLPCEDLENILSTGAAFAVRQKQEKSNPITGKSQEIKISQADLLGINMEGPFISPVKKGAQDARHIRQCDTRIAEQFLKAGEGLVQFLAIAPEENPRYDEFIREMKDQVKISLAHTNADYDTAKQAFSAGASHAVHLYNAMPSFSHREPGVIGAVLDSPHVTAEMICDGIHVHPSAVRAAFRMLGRDRIILISDSMRAAGLPDGRYMLGGQDVDVQNHRAVLAANGALAGSVSSLLDCLRTAVQKMEIPLEDAVLCSTFNPAKKLGIEQQYGSIQPGKRADFLLLDSQLHLQLVVKNGIPCTDI